MLNINFLKAEHGDAIHISYKDSNDSCRNILIDGGIGRTYRGNVGGRPKDGQLKILVDNIKEKDEKIDLLIITHWDDDHLGGILKWFESDNDAKDMIGNIWFNAGVLINEYFQSNQENPNCNKLNIFNSPQTSTGQGITFEKVISESGIWNRQLVKAGDTVEKDGIKFIILSPTDSKLKKLLKLWEKKYDPKTSGRTNDYDKRFEELLSNTFEEDKATHNGSSIAFILEVNNKKMLFLGDSHPSVICESLREQYCHEEIPLKIDMVKVSHHGSKGNTSEDLLDIIDCDKFVISVNGKHHALPHKETLAKIVNKKHGCKLYFNYPELIEQIFTAEELANDSFDALPVSELVI